MAFRDYSREIHEASGPTPRDLLIYEAGEVECSENCRECSKCCNRYCEQFWEEWGR